MTPAPDPGSLTVKQQRTVEIYGYALGSLIDASDFRSLRAFALRVGLHPDRASEITAPGIHRIYAATFRSIAAALDMTEAELTCRIGLTKIPCEVAI